MCVCHMTWAIRHPTVLRGNRIVANPPLPTGHCCIHGHHTLCRLSDCTEYIAAPAWSNRLLRGPLPTQGTCAVRKASISNHDASYIVRRVLHAYRDFSLEF